MRADALSATGRQRTEELLHRFERLAPGSHLIFLSADPALYSLWELEDRFPGQFDWWPLEDGPRRWQILIVRRERTAPRRRRVGEFLDRDHVRLGALISEVREHLEAQEVAEAARKSAHLVTGYRRHVRMEEEILLPAVTRRVGNPKGLAVVLHEQHKALEAALSEVAAGCALLITASGPVPGPLLARLDDCQSMLADHLGLEEQFIYPVTDHLFSEPERQSLVQQCMAME